MLKTEYHLECLIMRNAIKEPPTKNGTYMALHDSLKRISELDYTTEFGWNTCKFDGKFLNESAFPKGAVVAWCTLAEWRNALFCEEVPEVTK